MPEYVSVNGKWIQKAKAPAPEAPVAEPKVEVVVEDKPAQKQKGRKKKEVK